MKLYKTPPPQDFWGTVFLNFSKNLAMQHICRHYYMIKLIKITIKYIKGAYTTDKHSLIIGIPFLQVG